jgi:hypothetical protein
LLSNATCAAYIVASFNTWETNAQESAEHREKLAKAIRRFVNRVMAGLYKLNSVDP